MNTKNNRNITTNKIFLYLCSGLPSKLPVVRSRSVSSENLDVPIRELLTKAEVS